MEKLINKLKQLIKEDEQIGTSKDIYSWTKQQGVLITSNDASYIVVLLERLAKLTNEAPGALPIFDVSGSYSIDFGKHCKAKIQIKNGEPKVEAAMNGWGDGISLSDITIEKL